MPRFFTDAIQGNQALILGPDARHLSKVLRIRPGEELTVCDGRGTDYRCRVVQAEEEAVRLEICSSGPNETEPRLSVTLYQALPKGDKLEWILQKAVELGAARIVPVQTRYCVAKLTQKEYEKKRPRYERIVLEAAKQCGRGIIPEVGNLLTLEQALAECTSRSIVCYEGGGSPIRDLVRPEDETLSLLIGSEGGFSPEEIHLCESAGVSRATLGKRILRCETAPIAALTLVFAAAGEM